MTQAIDIAADRAIIAAATPGPKILDRETALGFAAQAWCYPATSKTEMDGDLCEAFADILQHRVAETIERPAALDEIERLRAALDEREATIGELRAGLHELTKEARQILPDRRLSVPSNLFGLDQATFKADALLAKTAPAKEGT